LIDSSFDVVDNLHEGCLEMIGVDHTRGSLVRKGVRVIKFRLWLIFLLLSNMHASGRIVLLQYFSDKFEVKQMHVVLL